MQIGSERNGRERLARLRRALASGLVAAGLSLAAPLSSAQHGAEFQDCQDEYLELWVDPVNGTDPGGCGFDPCTQSDLPQCTPLFAACRAAARARAGNPSQPYLTLNAAIWGAWLALCPVDATFSQALIHANPGIYSPDTNGEMLPIVMRTAVHVQGVGAKETVLRGGSDPVRCFEPYVPWNPGSLGPQPGRSPQEILVDFSFTLPAADGGPFLDAFTFQGGDIQVYEETEDVHMTGGVSNCVFDMRHGWADEVEPGWIVNGPLFGVLVVNRYFGGMGGPYYETEFQVLNNTFVQGWRATDAASALFTETARAENVAVCNTNEPLDDPDPTQRGVGSLSVQNNLIRCLPDAPRTAFLGIDRLDTTAFLPVGSATTNAFSSTLVGGTSVDPAMTFASAIVPPTSLPIPAVDLLPDGAVDPAFVGEMLNNQFNVTQTFRVRDWRLLPSSALVDEGTAPVDDDPDDCDDGDLIALNGTRYSGFGRERVYDFDGEVHGNPRIVGASVDIGFDETDVLCIAGSYGNDTKSHNTSWDPATLPAGQLRRTHVFPDLNQAGAATFQMIAQAVPYASPPAWTNMPGSIPFPIAVFINGGTLFVGLRWVQAGFIQVGPFNVPQVLYTNPIDGSVHVLRVFRATHNELTDQFVPPPGSPDVHFFDEQAGYFPGSPVNPILSNLQSEYL